MFSKASKAAWKKQQQHFRRADVYDCHCLGAPMIQRSSCSFKCQSLRTRTAGARFGLSRRVLQIYTVYIYIYTCCLKVKHVNKKRRVPDLKMSSPQNDPSCSAKAGHSAGDLSSMLLFAFRRILAQLLTSEKPFVHRWNTSNSCDPTCTQKVHLGNNLRGASRKLTGVKVFGKTSQLHKQLRN